MNLRGATIATTATNARVGYTLGTLAVLLALLIFADVASAQIIAPAQSHTGALAQDSDATPPATAPTQHAVKPEAPKPKTDRKVFIAGTALLAASKTADAVISGQLLNCGGVEQNPLFGRHPSPAKQAGVNAGIFAGEVLAFHFTERNRHAWVRWLGRAAIGLESEEHVRAFAHNAELHTIQTSQGCRVVP